jgi:tripartite-type tricarboxylate transporter receptor subunit TctC
MKTMLGSFRSAALTAALFAGLALPAAAFDMAGKRITWIVPFEEGGGSDVLARLFQPYLERELKATVIVLNLPGGASIKGANKFEATAETDGTYLMVASSATFAAAALEQQSVHYDPLHWEPIVGLPRGAVLFANPEKTGVKGQDMVADLMSLKSAEVVVPAKSPTGSEILDLVSLDILGVKPKVVFGLSTSQARQAFFRGEITIGQEGTGPYLSAVAEANTGVDPVPFLTYGYFDTNGSLQRDPDLPDVPTVLELYQAAYGTMPSGPSYDALLNLMNLKVSLSKVVVLPKGTPQDIVDGYIAAFQKIAADPVVVEKLKDEVGSLPIAFGADTRKVIEAGVKMLPSTRDWIADYLRDNHAASL